VELKLLSAVAFESREVDVLIEPEWN